MEKYKLYEQDNNQENDIKQIDDILNQLLEIE